MTIEKKKNGKLICRAVNGKVFFDKRSCIAYEADVYYPNVSAAIQAEKLKAATAAK